MIVLASFGFLACLLLAAAFAVAIPAAVRADRADHLLHKPGTCNECEDQS